MEGTTMEIGGSRGFRHVWIEGEEWRGYDVVDAYPYYLAQAARRMRRKAADGNRRAGVTTRGEYRVIIGRWNTAPILL